MCTPVASLRWRAIPRTDPNIWVGGISDKDYKSITSKKNNYPNQSRPSRASSRRLDVQGGVVARAVKAGYSLQRLLQLPVGLPDRRHAQGNYESQATASSRCAGDRGVVRHDLLQVRVRDVAAPGRAAPKKGTKDPFTEMAKAYGLGKPTGLDLPSESDGRIADRAWKRAYWKATKDFYCAKAKTGYPEVARKDPSGRHTCCSCPRRTASTGGPTAVVTPPTSRSARATRRRRRCRWRASTRRSPTAARWSHRTSARRS
jgi:penicillin-binding protein 2